MRTILRSERQRPTPMSATFHRAQIGEEEIAAVIKTLRSGYLTFGPKTHEFQQAFAETIGAAQAIAVNSCTAALHLALDALELPPGAEVITSTLTFTATAAAIVHAGAKPVLADVTPDTLNLDPRDVERKITPHTRAIVPVHFAGHPAPMEELLELTRRHDLRMVEDAAHALPSSHRGRRIGTIGDVTAFSFNATENLTTGDGGMVTTRDAGLDRKIRFLRQHGMLRNDGPAEVVAYNYRLTDIQAAVARKQLRRLPSMLAERRAQVAYYCDKLSHLPVELPRQPNWARSNWQSFCVRVHGDRDRLLQALAERGISARGGIMNAHQQPAYQPSMPLPHSEAATREGLILPLFPGMTRAQQDRVVAALGELLR